MPERASPSAKTHTCDVCHRRFSRLEHLQRHTRTHTQEKPFKCFCGKSFTRNDLLKRHRLREHISSIEPLSLTESHHTSSAFGGIDISQEESIPASGVSSSGQNPFFTDVMPGPGQASTNTLDSQQDELYQGQLQDFASFIGSVGLAPDWDNFDFFDDISFDALKSHVAAESSQTQVGALERVEIGVTPNTIPAYRRLEQEAPRTNAIDHSLNPVEPRWRISEQQRSILINSVASFDLGIPQIKMPSRHTLSRYFQSYADQFHKHYPMIHLATYQPETSPIALSLAVAAVGAQYLCERKNGLALYDMARSAALKQRKLDCLKRVTELVDVESVAMIQTLVLLIAYGAWDWKIELLNGALDFQSMAAVYVCFCMHGIVETGEDQQNWHGWIRGETRRRTVLIAFAYLNILSSAYELPPVVLNHEVQDLTLPASSAMWEARSSEDWQIVSRDSIHWHSRSFGDALEYLLGPDMSGHSFTLSPLGSFIMLQAIIQRINVVRQLQLRSQPSLPAAEQKIIGDALLRWKIVWQRTPNLSLDPRHPDGPIPFTSAAFLASAYARLHINLAICRQLHTRDPDHIARCLQSTPTPERNKEAMPALLHAAHTLSIPVQMGIEYASGSHTYFWSCQHSLCALESGVFLWKFLDAAGNTIDDDLNADEKRIVSWTRFSVAEALQSISTAELSLSDDVDVASLTLSQLGVAVLRIWARIFSKNRTWALTNEIGASLSLLADSLTSELG